MATAPKKKESKSEKSKDLKGTIEGASLDTFGNITTSQEFKSFLNAIRDKMSDEIAAPIYAVSAMNYAMNIPNVYEFLDAENKELARDIWLRLKASGLQLRNPPLLFAADEANGINGSASIGRVDGSLSK